MVFMLKAVHYYCDQKALTAGKLSLTDLGGTSKTPRGLLDIIVFKADILESWLSTELDTCRLSSDDARLIRKNMSDFTAYELACADGAWDETLLSPSGKRFANLVKAMCTPPP